MEDPNRIEQDKQRAEVFDALGHPTRILILKVLSDGPLGFAELKKKTAIESSGHLQHHLTKLNGLIKTDEYGKYCLSDEGKDALLTVQTVENASPKKEAKGKEHRHLKIGLKPVAFLLMALLITSSAMAVYEYSQVVGLKENYPFSNGVDPEAAAYYAEFGEIPVTNVNSSFTPPISLYTALIIGLQAKGWNKTSLNGMGVGAYLSSYSQISADGSITSLSPLSNIPANYSDIHYNSTVYGYVWQITVQYPGFGFPQCTLVDASTGQILT